MQAATWGTSIGLGEAMGAPLLRGLDPETADFSDEAVRTALRRSASRWARYVNPDGLSRELEEDWLWVGGMRDTRRPGRLRGA